MSSMFQVHIQQQWLNNNLDGFNLQEDGTKKISRNSVKNEFTEYLGDDFPRQQIILISTV